MNCIQQMRFDDKYAGYLDGAQRGEVSIID